MKVKQTKYLCHSIDATEINQNQIVCKSGMKGILILRTVVTVIPWARIPIHWIIFVFLSALHMEVLPGVLLGSISEPDDVSHHDIFLLVDNVLGVVGVGCLFLFNNLPSWNDVTLIGLYVSFLIWTVGASHKQAVCLSNVLIRLVTPVVDFL